MGSSALFGTDLVGANTRSIGANATYCGAPMSVGPLTIRGSAGKICFVGTGSLSAKVKMLIYRSSDETLIATSDERVGIDVGWNDFTFSIPFTLSATTGYRVGFITDTALDVKAESSPFSAAIWNTSTPYASNPLTTLTGTSDGSYKLSAYLTGTYDRAVLGNPEITHASQMNGSAGANTTYVTKYVADASFIANSGAIYESAAGVHKKMVVYADSAGAPGALLWTSDEKTTTSTGYNTFQSVTGLSITAGTTYWLGYIENVNSYVPVCSPGGTASWSNSSTPYANGPLNPMSGGIGTTYRIVGMYLGAPDPARALSISKALGYAAIQPPVALSTSKILGYAVLSSQTCIDLSKILGYAVLDIGTETEPFHPPILVSVT